MPAITLTDLSAVMRDFPSFVIVPENAAWNSVPVLQILKSRVDRSAFKGNRIEVKMKTKIGGYAEGFQENQDIPGGRAPAFVTEYIPLKEIIANAQLTMQTRNRAVKGDSAWVDAVKDALADMMTYFNYVCEVSSAGNGTGCVGVVQLSGSSNGSGVSTVVLKNTYTDLGIENTQLLQPGMMIDIVDATDGVTVLKASKEITSVTFNKRGASDGYGPKTGTITYADTALGIDENDMIFLSNSRDKLPMGLQGIIQDGTAYSGQGQVATFQNILRTGRPGLRSKIWKATDFGLASESPVNGTPTLWALSAISDAILQAETDSGMQITDLLCHGDLAAAINKLNQSSNGINVMVSNTGGISQTAVGRSFAKTFETADGRSIPIRACRTMPRHVLWGISADALHWSAETEFDFMRLYGDVWMPTKDDRKAAFEAPYYGSYNVWTERCDCHFAMLDMRVDV